MSWGYNGKTDTPWQPKPGLVSKRRVTRQDADEMARLRSYDTAGAGVRELGKAWMRVWEKVWERGTDQDAREAIGRVRALFADNPEATADELQWAFRPVGT